MNECLRCGKVCERALFCDDCQFALLDRSLQKEETHEALSQASLMPRASIAEPGPPKRLIQDPVIRSSLLVPVQDVGDGREQERFPDTPDGASLHAKQGTTLAMLQTLSPQHIRLSRLRRIFLIIVIIAIIALIADLVLVFMVLSRNRIDNRSKQEFPMMTAKPAKVYSGQIALLHLSHFPARSHVLLRRDIGNQVRLDNSSPLVQVSSMGEADVRILVEDNWGVGNHFIEAEDIESHYIASAAIQVIGSDPPRNPHLQVRQNDLDLGADLQSANTLQSLTLENTGGGMISWTAQSNQPWLVLTPMQGLFSVSQRVVIAVNRSNLKPGVYEGTVTFVANKRFNVPVHIKMSVLPLKTDLGEILIVSPPVLSFSTTDGGPDPAAQLLTVGNPGSRPLYWSLSSSAPMVSIDGEIPFMSTMDWLTIKPTSGVIAPGSTASIHFKVSSRKLLPSVYSSILTFTAGQNALNSPQSVAVSLDVQPRCGIMTSVGNVSFTMVTNQKNPAGQSLALSLSPNCGGSVAWQSSSMADWLAITPSSGRVKAQINSLTTVTADSTGLSPGIYTSFIVFLTERRTQTVAVELTVLTSSDKSATSAGTSTNGSSPTGSGASNKKDGTGATSAGEPALGISPTSVIFRVTEGENNPPDQAVTVVNTGGGLLYWQAREDTFGSSWLHVAPTTGSVAGGQSGHIFLSVDTSSLSPGTYRSNVVMSATDSSGTQVPGSPQVLPVTLDVVQPCILEVTPTNLTFSSSLLAPNPPAQDITLKTSGNCAYPVTWTATVDADSRSWLVLSAVSGQDRGNGSVITVRVNTSGILIGFYRGQISFSATDSQASSARGTPQTVEVGLTVIG